MGVGVGVGVWVAVVLGAHAACAGSDLELIVRPIRKVKGKLLVLFGLRVDDDRLAFDFGRHIQAACRIHVLLAGGVVMLWCVCACACVLVCVSRVAVL